MSTMRQSSTWISTVRHRARLLVLTGLTLLATMLGLTISDLALTQQAAHAASSVGGPITRSEVLARAQFWIGNSAIQYSQQQSDAHSDGTGGMYRPDCSGYVSMAWHLPKRPGSTWDYNTDSLPDVSHVITKDELLPGDIMLRIGGDQGHTMLFNRWLDSGRTEFEVLEQGHAKVGPDPVPNYPHVTRYIYKSATDSGFKPYRYNNIVEDLGATPTGLLGDVNGDGRVDVLARDGNGALWLYPNSGGSGVNTFGTRSQVGTSWNGMSAIEVGDLNSDGRVDVVSREAATGALWLYPNTGGTGMNTFGARSQIGTGWNGMSAIGLGDLNSDGRVDVVSREATTGALWLYPNAGGTGMNTFGARSQVGTGWNGMSAINLGDLNSDGKVDIVSREATTGALWLYPNAGGTGINTFGPRSQVGSGWNGMSAINLGDLNSDGRVDIISREATTGALWLYPNAGGTGINTFGPRSQVGSSWNGMTDID